jgi:UDP-glucose 4-epimerase
MGRILVTGGAGFIGSHTVVALQENDCEVIIADDLSNSEEAVISRIAKITGIKPVFEKVDLTCAKDTLHLFETYKPDAVIHFAAYKAVGESVQKPFKYYRNNVVALLNVLDGMHKIGCERIVFSSSCTVYGTPDELPVTEKTSRKKAMSPYGNTKKIAEDILADAVYAAYHNDLELPLKAVSLRYFNPIGAHPSALIGELPLGVPNNLMPYITQTAAGIRPVLNVFGNDYNTPDGTCIRDYIHVCDLAEAHVAALKYNKVSSFIETFNIGTGQGYSVLEVIKSFEKMSGIQLNYEFGPRRRGDIEKIWGSPAKAEELLGWRAERSLDCMTDTAWKWQVALGKMS